jgi:aspartate/methionine/tyrosine aminotransferase
MIIINNPHNPTGKMTQSDFEALEPCYKNIQKLLSSDEGVYHFEESTYQRIHALNY